MYIFIYILGPAAGCRSEAVCTLLVQATPNRPQQDMGKYSGPCREHKHLANWPYLTPNLLITAVNLPPEGS